MKEYFLDCNAHCPMSQKAIQALIDFNKSLAGHGHPSSPNIPGRKANQLLEESREKIAELIGAKKSAQVIFTPGATYGAEWGLDIFKKLGKEFYISPFEHPSVSLPCESWTNLTKLDINSDGEIKITENMESVICVLLQNEIGTIQNLNKKCKYLFSDISQALGKIKVDVSDLNLDIAIAGAHKFGGPGNIGFIYLKDLDLWREFGTGSRYFLDSPGTPNVAGVYAMSVALEESINTLPGRTKNMIDFRNILEPGLEKFGIEIIGKNWKRCPNTSFGYIKNLGIKLVTDLGDHGVYIGLGSACGSITAGKSKILEVIGKTSAGNFDGFRISQWGNYDKKDADLIINIIEKKFKYQVKN